MSASRRPPAPGPKDRACNALGDLWASSSPAPALEDIKATFPKRWDVYGDLVLFSELPFVRSPLFRDHLSSSDFWQTLATAFGVKRVALRGAVAQDDFRSSGVRLVLGEKGTVQHRDNGILYQWDITRCMFSRGNITEKLRIASWDCRNEVIVDLYAGIGYFALPYLLKAKARYLHACEWNPEALKALRTNLQLNKVPEEAFTIHAGDNRTLCPRGVAQRVNLGLLPTARPSWAAAAMALDPSTGGWLHVHENVTCSLQKEEEEEEEENDALTSNVRLKRSWTKFCEELQSELGAVFAENDPQRQWSIRARHVQFVKSYAPHIDHVVCDVLCRPSGISKKLDTFDEQSSKN